MSEYELTILMPCLNEAETIGVCIDKAKGYMESHAIEGEVLIADNGSTDGSQRIAEARGARVIHVKEKGYGNALKGGIAAARGRYVIMGDADDSYDFSSLAPFLEKLQQGYELVMGNRFKGGIKIGAMPPLHRYFGNPVLTAIGRLFFKSAVGDFHCGLRGFNRCAIQQLGLTAAGMEFASEMVVKATFRKLRITEVPTTLSPDGRTRPPHLRSWRDGWRNLRFLLLFSPRWLFLYPGCTLILIGFTVMLWLVPGPRSLGSLTLDVNTLAYSAAAIVCGMQAVLFSLFTKVFAINTGLLPEDPLTSNVRQHFRLEIGIAIGIGLVACGLLTSTYAVGFWGSRGFGSLDPTISLRIVIPAVVFLIVGLQMLLSSFFLAVLWLDKE